MLCESCGEKSATVFATKIINGKMTHSSLCEECARHIAGASIAPIEDLVRDLFEHMDDLRTSENEGLLAGSQNEDLVLGLNFDALANEFGSEFPADEDLADELDELDAFEDETDDEDELLQSGAASGPPAFLDFNEPRERREITAKRCPKCAITWDRLRQDGRAGCSCCYETFAEQLQEVMQRVQRAPEHTGKRPRAADKRRRRKEQERTKRGNRLEMLNRRLQEAISQERYEEAAKLRDRIRNVSNGEEDQEP